MRVVHLPSINTEPTAATTGIPALCGDRMSFLRGLTLYVWPPPDHLVEAQGNEVEADVVETDVHGKERSNGDDADPLLLQGLRMGAAV